jgi:hypothetical protein
MDFELFQRFYVKLDLTKLWSLKLFATAIETLPELNFGQGVFNCVLQHVFYNLADMPKITPNIHKVIAFTTWLSVKQNSA